MSNQECAAMKFRDIPIGATFDFISPSDVWPRPTFYLRCTKVSARSYTYVDGGATYKCSVGTINVQVYNVAVQS